MSAAIAVPHGATGAGAGPPPAAFERVLARGVFAVLRFDDAAHLLPAARACAEGGVLGLEVTLTTPGALDAVAALAADRELAAAGAVIGAGSVLSPAAAELAVGAGAAFVVSPVGDLDIVALCRARGVAAVPGGFTPTELARLAASGAAAVKLFPATSLGPGYVRDVRAPMPGLRLVPTGGVTAENAGAWIRAGAAAVGAGSALADPALLAAGRLGEVAARARAFVAAVAAARADAPRGAPAMGDA